MNFMEIETKSLDQVHHGNGTFIFVQTHSRAMVRFFGEDKSKKKPLKTVSYFINVLNVIQPQNLIRARRSNPF